MSYNLFLDDIRDPPLVGNYMNPIELRPMYRKYKWIIVRSYEQFIQTIAERGIPEIISFDHDLQDEHYQYAGGTVEELQEYYGLEDREMTGYDCAKFLTDFMLDKGIEQPITFYVHSLNPSGRENIKSLLFRWNKQFQ